MIGRNAISATAQAIASALVLFVVYGVVINRLGSTALGIWALVLASTSAGRIASLGMSGSVVKYVAEHLGKSNAGRARDIVETSVISIAIFTALAVALLWPVGNLFLRWLLDDAESIEIAVSLLPYALGSLFLGQLIGPVMGGLDGVGRIDLRSATLVSGTVIYLAGVLATIDAFGLTGLAIAQLIQQLWNVSFGWLLLRRHLSVGVLPFRWRQDCFRETIGYSLHFQFIAITQLFFEPVVKGLIEAFDGLGAVGVYEVASRIILQVRAIILSGFSALVPHIARLQAERQSNSEAEDGTIDQSLRTSIALTFLFGLPALSVFMPLATAIGRLWFETPGEIRLFAIFLVWLSLGWIANLVAAPAYFLYLADGRIQINTTSNFARLLANIALAAPLGLVWGAAGVAAAGSIALAAGSVVLLRPVASSVLSVDRRWNMNMAAATALVFGISLAHVLRSDSSLIALGLTAAWVTVFASLAFHHPARRSLQTTLTQQLDAARS